MLVFQVLVIEKTVFELKEFHDHNYCYLYLPCKVLLFSLSLKKDVFFYKFC